MKFTKILLLFFVISCPLLAFAELPKQVEADFAVLNGQIVMPVGEAYIVDLDGSNGLREGDILTLVSQGKKIIHPETRQIIGTVDIPTGYLQVTRVSSGYSYAKLLSAESELKSGALVRRFEQVPTFFIDKRGDGGGLSSQIKMDLPQLRWLSDQESVQALLTFTLEAGSLVVRTAEGNQLHRYRVTDDLQLAAPPAPALPSFVAQRAQSEPNALQLVANSFLGVIDPKNDENWVGSDVGIVRSQSAKQEGVWISQNFDGEPVGIAVADLDGDGLKEVVVAFNNKVRIGQISDGKYIEKAEVPVPSRLQILSLDAIDLDNNGRPELYLTAVGNQQLASFVIDYDGSVYSVVADNVQWYLRVVELHGLGQVLIGQLFGQDDKSYYGRPFLVRSENNRLVRGADVAIPAAINIYSFVPFTDLENKSFYAYLTQNDYLKVVSADGVELWESSEYFGGSETCFDNRLGNKGDMVVPTCIGPRLVKTETNELLVVQNIGQRIMQRYNKYKISRIVSMSWNGYVLIENWRTAGQKGYLSDFTVADADNDGKLELAMAVKFKHKGLVDAARSSIVSYDLD